MTIKTVSREKAPIWNDINTLVYLSLIKNNGLYGKIRADINDREKLKIFNLFIIIYLFLNHKSVICHSKIKTSY